MYSAFITKIESIRDHTNADRLKIAQVLGTNVIVGLDYQPGDIVCYFGEGGQLSKEFCEVNKLTKPEGFFEHPYRVRTLKLRGEVSDGFVCKLEMLERFAPGSASTLKVGDRINTLGGKMLCQKYMTPATQKAMRNKSGEKQNYVSRASTLTFPRHNETDNIMIGLSVLKKGDVLTIDSKMHGTSARTGNTLHEIRLPSWKRAINKYIKIFPTREYKLVSGSRNVILCNTENDEKMRVACHKYFEGKLYKGEIVFYEVVGYEPSGKSIMGAHLTGKLNDKAFTAKYGEKMVYNYGCAPGNFQMYIYRIVLINEDGYMVDLTHDEVKRRAAELGLPTPHHYETFVYNGDKDALMAKIERYSDQQDPIGAHYQEGVCIRKYSSKWKCYKSKSFYFKVLEGLIKENPDYVDAEEIS